MIRTPDQRLRVFVSSTLGELAEERSAVRRAVDQLHLSPVMFELGARPHPPRELYRAYLEQSDVFVGIYWQRYGWVAPGESVSGLEDEYLLSDGLPRLLYIKEPALDREPAMSSLLRRIRGDDRASYRRFSTTDELAELVAHDLALLLSERFSAERGPASGRPRAPLPAPMTRIIGRAREIEEILGLFEGGTRLVTITGTGGVGKTRLAIEAARTAAGRGATVHFVPLASVSSPELVIPTVADHIGVRDSAAASPRDPLADYFAGRSVVLLLDNLEQVVASGPELVRLLEQAPGLQLLVTSRQALRVVGEHEVPLAPLGLPAEAATSAELGQSPSGQLLLERARERGVSLDLTEESSAAVAGLCRRLAGLPLAIELAVPRLRLHGPRALLDRLGSILDLPAAGEDLPSRQRTLRAALTWSHDLLDEAERAVFAQMSVFTGGCTLDGVEAVCVDAEGPVDTALAGLLDKSLVRFGDQMPFGEVRIHMLEPVREFAEEQLAARGGTAAARQRHLEYMLALGREAAPYLCGPRQREWAARFDAERANVRVAVETGLQTGQFAAALRLTWDTFVYYYIRDALEESRDWVLRIAQERDSLSDTERALLDVGLLVVGEPSDADLASLLPAAALTFDDSGLPLEAAVARHHLGVRLLRHGESSRGLEALEHASASYEAIDHDWGVAMVEMTLSAAHASRGRVHEARTHLEVALAHARRIDNRHQIAQALQGLALLDALRGRVDLASGELCDAAALVLAERWFTGATYCLEAFAAVALAQGAPADAVRLVGTARSLRTRRGTADWTFTADAADSVLEAARRLLDAASVTEHWQAGIDTDQDVFALVGGRRASLLAEEPGAAASLTAP